MMVIHGMTLILESVLLAKTIQPLFLSLNTMNTKELVAMIKTAEELGHSDIGIYIDDSRDGQTSHVRARARLLKTGGQMDETVILLVSYSND